MKASERLTCSERFHDVRAGVVDWRSSSGHEQLHVSLDISFLLQHDLGLDTVVGSLRSLQ